MDFNGWNGVSTGNITTPTIIETGTEVTTQSATTCSSSSSLGWYDAGYGFHSGWSDSSGNATIFTNSPPSAYWLSVPNWLRSYINIGC